MRHTTQVILMFVLFAGATIGCSDNSTSPGKNPPPPVGLTHRWSRAFGVGGFQTATAVAVDGLGDVFVVGSFDGTVDFGGGALTSAGGPDICVASFGPTGTHRWSQRFGDGGFQNATAVAVDGLGDVIVAGSFDGTVNFGGGDLTGTGGSDIFVASFDPSGAHRWSQRFGDGGFQNATAVAIDGLGDVIVAGSFDGTVNFGGGDLTSTGGSDIFMASFDPSGAHRWSQRFGDGNDQVARAVAIDGAGNVVVAGQFDGTVNFGGGDLTSAGLIDIFVASFDPTGTHRWSRRFGDGSRQAATAVAVDGPGNVSVAGYFGGIVNFGGGNLTSPSGDDIFVASFDPNGTHRWSQRFGDGQNQGAYAVAVDASGNVVVAGNFDGTVNFGGGDLTSAGGDVYLASFGPGGTHRWSQRFGDGSSQVANAVAVDGAGDVVVAGYFNGTVNFGGGNLTSAGFSDIFVAAFRQ